MTVPIRPDTRVAALLRDYPELEGVLLARSPSFAKLRNPILRRTVARVATLATAAKMADLPVTELVADLRAAAGLPPLAEDGGERGLAPRPPLSGEVAETIDAGALLDAGENPLPAVRAALDRLPEGRILTVLAPFRPVPLIETLEAEGYRIGERRGKDGAVEVQIGGPASSV